MITSFGKEGKGCGMVVLTLEQRDGSSTELVAWKPGGDSVVINHGHEPFLYTTEPPFISRLKTRSRIADVKEERLQLLSTGEERTCYRLITRKSWDVPSVAKELAQNGITPYEKDILYKNRFIMDVGVKHDDVEPVVVTWDIEVPPPDEFTFPNAERDAIGSIAARSSTGERFCSHGVDELGTLTAFRDWLRKVNPDVVVTFYGDLFDIPYLLTRLKRWNIADFLSRVPGVGCSYRDVGQRRLWTIPGRCNFDVSYEVNRDQRLSGIKNRKLETVAQHFKDKGMIDATPVVLPDGVYHTIQEKGLKYVAEVYGMADVDCTHEIATKVYYSLVETLATMILRCDLQSAVWRSPYWFSETLLGRRFEERGILCDGDNRQRHKQEFDLIDFKAEKENGELKPTGAIVILGHRGHFKDVHKLDFASMYPSIIVANNLSPETVHLVEIIRDVENPGWHVKEMARDDERRYLHIYDPNFECIWSIWIDIGRKGILPEYCEELMYLRKVERAVKADGFDIRQNAYKITNNSLFGNQRLDFAKRANVLVSITILGIGRQNMLDALDIVRVFDGDVIEVDTDGVYLRGLRDVHGVLTLINSVLDIVMEYDGSFPSGTFYKAKNYILINDKGDEVVKGIALKGTNKPKMCDTVVRELGHMIHRDEDILPYIKDLSLSSYDPGDYMITSRINKPIADYEVSTPAVKVAKYLIRQGMQVNVGDEMTYFWTRVGRKDIPLPASEYRNGKHKFSREKYAELVGNVVARVVGPLYYPVPRYDKLDDHGIKAKDRIIKLLGRAIRDYIRGKREFNTVLRALGERQQCNITGAIR